MTNHTDATKKKKQNKNLFKKNLIEILPIVLYRGIHTPTHTNFDV